VSLSNGQFHKIKTALTVVNALDPKYRWRAMSEQVHTNDLVALLTWASEQIEKQPQPFAGTVNS